MALENNIAIGAPGSIATPPAGEVTRFFNTDYTPAALYYKDENGNIFAWPDSSTDADCCACEIAKNFSEKMACSLASGMITAAEFESMVKQGVTVSAIENTDTDGNKTCNVTISPAFIAPTGVTVSPATINPLAVGNQQVAVATVAPANATIKSGVWSSSNPGVASVNSNGVITAVAAGVATITFTTALGGFSATCVVTVV